MTLRTLVTCDLAQIAEGGKNNLFGLFTCFFIQEFTSPLPPFWVHAQIFVDALEAPSEPVDIKCEATLEHRASGRILQRGELIGQLALPLLHIDGSSEFSLSLIMFPQAVPEVFGTHTLTLKLNGIELGARSIELIDGRQAKSGG